MSQTQTQTDKLATASSNFDKDMVEALNLFYELRTRMKDIYVMNRQAILDAAESGKLAELGLTLEVELERLLTEYRRGQQDIRAHLAERLVKASNVFAEATA